MTLLQSLMCIGVAFFSGYGLGFRVANLRTLKRLRDLQPWL